MPQIFASVGAMSAGVAAVRSGQGARRRRTAAAARACRTGTPCRASSASPGVAVPSSATQIQFIFGSTSRSPLRPRELAERGGPHERVRGIGMRIERAAVDHPAAHRVPADRLHDARASPRRAVTRSNDARKEVEVRVVHAGDVLTRPECRGSCRFCAGRCRFHDRAARILALASQLLWDDRHAVIRGQATTYLPRPTRASR